MIFSFIIYHLFASVLICGSIVQYQKEFSFHFYFKEAIILNKENAQRSKAILVGLVVTFIWATSWIMTPMIIKDFAPISYAGVRFLLAGLVLLVVHFFSKKATPIKTIQKKDWVLIVLLGLTQSSLMQFSQYIALQSVDPTTLNLLSNLSTILIIVMSVWILKESPTWLQLVGTGVFVLGVLAYYYPFGEDISNWWGYAMGGLFIIGGAFASILSRAMGRRGTVNSITYTAISMLVGGSVSLILGLFVDGVQIVPLRVWALVVYMAVVNAALAFVLWNWTYTHLQSFEAALISSTMLVEVAILQWLIMGRTFGGFEILGMGLVMVAVILVQLKKIEFNKKGKKL